MWLVTGRPVFSRRVKCLCAACQVLKGRLKPDNCTPTAEQVSSLTRQTGSLLLLQVVTVPGPIVSGYTITLQPCTSYPAFGGPVGSCRNAISKQLCGQALPLVAGGTLARALGTTCPAGEPCLPLLHGAAQVGCAAAAGPRQAPYAASRPVCCSPGLRRACRCRKCLLQVRPAVA